MVKPGDTVKAEDPLISLESDKATMDVPAPAAGVVKAIKVKVGDKVSEGSVILLLDAGVAPQPPRPSRRSRSVARRRRRPARRPASPRCACPTSAISRTCRSSRCSSRPGDTVKAEDPLVSLESDKATMDVPSPLGGIVQEVRVKVGDKVSRRHARAALATGAAPRRRRRAAAAAATPPRRRQPAPAPATASAPPAAAASGGRRRRRVRPRLCRPRRAQAGARTRRRPRQGQGHAATRAAS